MSSSLKNVSRVLFGSSSTKKKKKKQQQSTIQQNRNSNKNDANENKYDTDLIYLRCTITRGNPWKVLSPKKKTVKKKQPLTIMILILIQRGWCVHSNYCNISSNCNKKVQELDHKIRMRAWLGKRIDTDGRTIGRIGREEEETQKK